VESLKGAAATVSAAEVLAREADLVHFGCHNVFDAEHVSDSGLLLQLQVSDQTPGESYFLHRKRLSNEPDRAVSHVLSLKRLWDSGDLRRCRLLNLSACSTAMISTAGRSDEFYGLANGFAAAGADNILTALWPVSDAASIVFNKLFYDLLLSKARPPAIALQDTVEQFRKLTRDDMRQELRCVISKEDDIEKLISDVAMLGMSASDSGMLDHPLYWGAYRLVGDLLDSPLR
jgi:CHAT domain-containing protein